MTNTNLTKLPNVRLRRIAVLYGLLDSSAWIITLFGDSSYIIYYLLSVSCKTLAFYFLMKKVEARKLSWFWPFGFPIMITVCVSIISGTTNVEGVIQPLALLYSLVMTILVLDEGNVSTYMKAFGLSCFASCICFLLQLNFIPLNTTGVLEAWGRYSFISGSHPNLGGEILSAGFIALCAARLRAKIIVPTFLLYLISLNLLQSRAALLCLLMAFSVIAYKDYICRWAPLSRLGLMFALAICLSVAIPLNMDRISDAFQLDSEYRGVGSGFVGREDRWEFAWQLFLDYPLFGAGFGYFRQAELEDFRSHSMWLYMLSTMGLLSSFVLFEIFRNGWRVLTVNVRMFLLLLSFAPMTIFNDRFLNLNPYPFLLFVILFLPTNALRSASKTYEMRTMQYYPTRDLA